MGWFVFGLSIVIAVLWGIACPALGIPMGWQIGIWFAAYTAGHLMFAAITKALPTNTTEEA